jgi:hypothetical protein
MWTAHDATHMARRACVAPARAWRRGAVRVAWCEWGWATAGRSTGRFPRGPSMAHDAVAYHGGAEAHWCGNGVAAPRGKRWRCGDAESSFELRRSSMTCTEGGNGSVLELSMASCGGQNRRARQRLLERTTGRWHGQNVRGLSPFIGTPRMRATRSARGWDGWGAAAHAWQAR